MESRQFEGQETGKEERVRNIGGFEVKMISHEEAKRLGDEILIKYREAFEALKDR